MCCLLSWEWDASACLHFAVLHRQIRLGLVCFSGAFGEKLRSDSGQGILTSILLSDFGPEAFLISMVGMEGAQSMFLDALAAVQLVCSSWNTL
jgi:hypothetical protein